MARVGPSLRRIALWGVVFAALALVAGAVPAEDQPPSEHAAPEEDDSIRKAEVLASSRWRRAMHELDEWLAAQPVYPPERVRRIKADFERRVREMTSFELEYMLEGLDEKLKILDSPAATEARDWLGRYLAVMADERRAALTADVPNILDLSAAELSAQLAEVEARRAKVEKSADTSRTARQGFHAFVEGARRATQAERDRLGRLHFGARSFSPYRSQPVDAPPFADRYDSPTVVGVAPWGSFVDASFTAF